MKNILIFAFGFLLAVNVYSQNKAVVSSFTIKDELSKSDPVDPELGRYDAYELNVGKGDHVAFKLIAKKFQPFLLLVSPSKKSALKVPSKGKKTVLFDTLATEGGNWEFYVLGDTSSTGKYECTVAFATPDGLDLPKSKSICEKVKFLLTQSDGDFLFMQNNNLISKLFPPEKVNVSFGKKSLTVEFLNNNLQFSEFTGKIKNCLGEKYYSEKIENGEKFVENVFKKKHFVELFRVKNKEEFKMKVGREE